MVGCRDDDVDDDDDDDEEEERASLLTRSKDATRGSWPYY